MKNIEKPDLAVVVLSCDRYADLWKPFFDLFFRNWSDCPFKVYLFANEQSYSDLRVMTVLSGKDNDWSSSVKACVQQIPEKYLLLFFDDAFLDKPVNNSELFKLLSYLEGHAAEYLRFRPVPLPDEKIDHVIGRYKADTLYRTAVFGIWRRDVLLDVFKEGESAWDLETKGVPRSAKYTNFFGVYKEYFSYIHGVEKGQWYRSAVRKILKLGIEIDEKSRSRKSLLEQFQSDFRLFRAEILNLAPSRLRPRLMALSRFVRKFLFKRW